MRFHAKKTRFSSETSQSVSDREISPPGELKSDRLLGIYPIGSLLMLDSGRLGIVIEQAEKSLLTPRIKVFFSTRANARIRPEIIDLSRPGCQEKIVGREDPAKWKFPDLDELWSGQNGL